MERGVAVRTRGVRAFRATAARTHTLGPARAVAHTFLATSAGAQTHPLRAARRAHGATSEPVPTAARSAAAAIPGHAASGHGRAALPDMRAGQPAGQVVLSA